jgi:hypothetical protein
MHIVGGSNKKPRQHNWEHGEFLALVKVKRGETSLYNAQQT